MIKTISDMAEDFRFIMLDIRHSCAVLDGHLSLRNHIRYRPGFVQMMCNRLWPGKEKHA